jgi:lipoprotein NlpI
MLIGALLLLIVNSAQMLTASQQQMLQRAMRDFTNARIDESVSGFDSLAKSAPGVAPHLWQRGIALYYAGRYRDCRAQFESHRTVNPNDVENAAWHFLCVARAVSFEKARDALLPVGPDPRAPMREIYDMFRGDLTPEKVLASAGSQRSAQFYARLYVGLYYEAAGKAAVALEHIEAAADERFADAGGYMHDVARVHLRIRGR